LLFEVILTSVAPASCALDLLRSTRTSRTAAELVAARRNHQPGEHMNQHRVFTGEDARSCVPNEGTRRDRRFGSTRFSVNRYGDSAGRQLRDHHGRVQFSYNCNDGRSPTNSPASPGRFSPEVRPASRGLLQMPRDKGSFRSTKGIPAAAAPLRHHRSPHWASERRWLRGDGFT